MNLNLIYGIICPRYCVSKKQISKELKHLTSKIITVIPNKNNANCSQISGLVAMFIESLIPSLYMEAVAASFLMHNIITVCNIFIPNQTDLILRYIDNIMKRLPALFILTGDFNFITRKNLMKVEK